MIEKLNGIITAVMNDSTASVRSLPLHAREAGGHQHANAYQRAAAASRNHPASGERKITSRNRIPTTTAVRPVRPPTETPEEFDIGRHRRGTDEGPPPTNAIDKRRLLMRGMPVGIRETRFIRHANQRPGGVKRVDQRKGEDRPARPGSGTANRPDQSPKPRSAARRSRCNARRRHPARQGGQRYDRTAA